jgi:hypothetical protein
MSQASLHKKCYGPVRVSGRLKIAQRFIAGIARIRDEVRETDD